MANYAVDPSVLKPFLPSHTELDLWNGTCYVSLVGFLFKNTRVLGFKIPFHINFEEVNLRFYVKYNSTEGVRRGVVFIKEIVPKPAIAWVANTLYKENYASKPMKYAWNEHKNTLEVAYHWQTQNTWFAMKATAENKPQNLVRGSEAEFITEHYWGYARRDENTTIEYQVEHPSWQIYPVLDYKIEVDFEKEYGQTFGFLNQKQPLSVFLAEGSPIIVRAGAEI